MECLIYNPPLSNGTMGSYAIAKIVEIREEDVLVSLFKEYDYETGINIVCVDKDKVYKIPKFEKYFK